MSYGIVVVVRHRAAKTLGSGDEWSSAVSRIRGKEDTAERSSLMCRLTALYVDLQ
jgi:hypothetical protein